MTGQARIRQAGRLAVLGVIAGLALPAAGARAASGDLDLVSRASGATGAKGSFSSSAAGISADGRVVSVSSGASNFVPEDRDGLDDVYARDLQTDTTTLVSRASGVAGANSNGISSGMSLSADGRFVAFQSLASNLSADDGDATSDVYVRDLQTNTTTLVSSASGASGVKGNGASSGGPLWADSPGSLSADGRFVAFESVASNLSADDGDVTSDVYVRDLQTGTTTLVGRAGGATGAKSDGESAAAAISGGGRFVAFGSSATNLSPDDGDDSFAVFVRDLQTSTTTLVSRAGGANGAKANGGAWPEGISSDGRFVVLESEATNLSPDDGDATSDVFVRD